jgi:hypothetical protein
LAAGAIAAALPIIAANVLNGAFLAWLNDILVTALLIHGQDFIAQSSFAYWLEMAFEVLISGPSALSRISALGWIVTILMVPATLAICVRYAYSTKELSGIEALPIIAPFWAVVAVHYQIPIYLFFVLPVVVAALLFQGPKPASVASVWFVVVWAVVFQAGQPLSRNYVEMIAGARAEHMIPADLPRVSMKIPAQDREVFASVIERIEAIARPDEPLMTLPMDPELNFMTGRPTPQNYYGTPLGLQTESDVAHSLDRLVAAAPIFVVVRRDDKYLTPLSIRLLEEVRSMSPDPVSIGPFDLYRLPSPDEVNRRPLGE